MLNSLANKLARCLFVVLCATLTASPTFALYCSTNRITVQCTDCAVYIDYNIPNCPDGSSIAYIYAMSIDFMYGCPGGGQKNCTKQM